jgi:hypothetical protein
MAKELRGATCALPMASAMAEASPSILFYHLLGLGRPASFAWNRPSRPTGRRPARSEGASGAGRAHLGALPPASPCFASPRPSVPWRQHAAGGARGGAAPFETSRPGFTGPVPGQIAFARDGWRTADPTPFQGLRGPPDVSSVPQASGWSVLQFVFLCLLCAQVEGPTPAPVRPRGHAFAGSPVPPHESCQEKNTCWRSRHPPEVVPSFPILSACQGNNGRKISVQKA